MPFPAVERADPRVSFEESGDPGLLNRFGVSLLTEGSGTQIFSTTFVQWAAREVLRRAQPVTLLARFAPRQRERAMNELLGECGPIPRRGHGEAFS